MIFLHKQDEKAVQDYVDTLASVGSLSRLFSESDKPFLYYRAAENIFCKVFDADNKSRSDVSVDATKDGIGIGLKTFLFRGDQFEKVAEFNKTNSEYASLSTEELVNYIATARNDRIESTTELYNLKENIYHCVARTSNKFIVYEVPMDTIDIPNIGEVSVSPNGNSLSFSDGKNEYKFNKTKSTLFKKFVPPRDVLEFDVTISSNPYALISDGSGSVSYAMATEGALKHSEFGIGSDYIILPLFSPKVREGGDKVGAKSGLNLWRAEGRPRNPNEVYIPIPPWIHREFSGFLPPQDESFSLVLPNGDKINVKVCQQNGKALMSNPNRDLGEWILRKVLRLKEWELLTYSKLVEMNIDSVAIYRNESGEYSIEVRSLGSYDDFYAKYAPVIE